MSEAAAPTTGANGRCRGSFAQDVGLPVRHDSRYRRRTAPVTDDATSSLSRSTSLSGAISRLGQICFDQVPVNEVLDLVARLAVDVIPGATGATLTLPRRKVGHSHDPVVVGSHDSFVGLESVPCPSAGAILEDRQVHAQGDLSPLAEFPSSRRQPRRLRCDWHSALPARGSTGLPQRLLPRRPVQPSGGDGR
jgi:hypothetical protein